MSYDTFRTTKAAAKKYRRCRIPQYYILVDNCRQLDKIICPTCKRSIADDPAKCKSYRGNRAIYYPARKKSIVQHYTCAWSSLFQDLFELANYMC